MEEKQKGRSSLRFKTLNFEYHSNNPEKKIQWNITESLPNAKKSYPKDPKTPYISYV